MSEPCTSPVPLRCMAMVGGRICDAPAKYYWTRYDDLQGPSIARTTITVCAACCVAGSAQLSEAFSIQLIAEVQRG